MNCGSVMSKRQKHNPYFSFTVLENRCNTNKARMITGSSKSVEQADAFFVLGEVKWTQHHHR